VPQFEAKLFFEGAKRRKDLEQFAVLLFLSTVIGLLAMPALGGFLIVLGIGVVKPKELLATLS
jgi:hypothetical protein